MIQVPFPFSHGLLREFFECHSRGEEPVYHDSTIMELRQTQGARAQGVWVSNFPCNDFEKQRDGYETNAVDA